MNRERLLRRAPFILTILASVAFFIYSLLFTGISVNRPATALFNGAILLVSSGCLAAIVSVFASERPALNSQLRLFIIATWFSAATLLMALVVALVLIGNTDAFSLHVFDTWKFIGFISVVLFLLYGPDWLTMNTTRSYRFAPFYDGFQLILVPLVLLTNGPGRVSSIIEIMFRFWLSIMLMTNGFEMLRGRSSFHSNLSEAARRMIPGDVSIYPKASTTVVRFGAIIIASGLGLATFTLFEYLS